MESKCGGEEGEQEFRHGEIVWAKIIGYPWWPARVTQLPTTRNPAFRVDFFYDNSHAFLTPSKILRYEDMRSDFDLHRHMPKGLRRAISQADRLFQEETGPRDVSELSQAPVEEPIHNQKQLSKSPFPHSLLQENNTLHPIAQQNEEPNHGSESHHLHSEQQQQAPPASKYTRQQTEKYLQTLLKKYRLLTFPKLSAHTVPPTKSQKRVASYNRKKTLLPKRSPEPKVKMISKLLYEKHSLSFLLTRKIYSVLKDKAELSPIQRKQISSSLSRQVLSGTTENVNGLFKWLTISPSPIIASFYQNWGSMQGDKEKSSNMTTEQ